MCDNFIRKPYSSSGRSCRRKVTIPDTPWGDLCGPCANLRANEFIESVLGYGTAERARFVMKLLSGQFQGL